MKGPILTLPMKKTVTARAAATEGTHPNPEHKFYVHDPEAGDYSTNDHDEVMDYLRDHSLFGTKPVMLRTRHPDNSETTETFHPGDLTSKPAGKMN